MGVGIRGGMRAGKGAGFSSSIRNQRIVLKTKI